MVRIRWKFWRGKVYLEIHANNCLYFYWFSKIGLHKKFHSRQIFTRKNTNFKAHKDDLIYNYMERTGWIEGELEDRIVKEKLGIQILTETELYEQLAKAC